MTTNHQSQPAEVDTRRRRLLNGLWMILGAIGLAELIWLVTTFLSARRPATNRADSGKIVSVGRVSDFDLNTVTAFQRGGFYLVRLGDGGFLAVSRRCTHLGCTLPWIAEERRFVCPCHASAFDITGAVISSPAPRAMDLLSVRIENDVVEVDTGARIRRNAYRREQAVYQRAGKM